jgi:hypothetical protein
MQVFAGLQDVLSLIEIRPLGVPAIHLSELNSFGTFLVEISSPRLQVESLVAKTPPGEQVGHLDVQHLARPAPNEL